MSDKNGYFNKPMDSKARYEEDKPKRLRPDDIRESRFYHLRLRTPIVQGSYGIDLGVKVYEISVEEKLTLVGFLLCHFDAKMTLQASLVALCPEGLVAMGDDVNKVANGVDFRDVGYFVSELDAHDIWLIGLGQSQQMPATQLEVWAPAPVLTPVG